MKYTIPCLAAMLAITSTGWAMCPGARTPRCPAPVASRDTVYISECGNCRWIPPSTHNPFYVLGSIVTAPFRLLTGRELGHPDVVASRDFVTPGGSRLVTTTRSQPVYDSCGRMTGKRIIKDRMLEPVGERITTVKVIRTVPMRKPLPVGEHCFFGKSTTTTKFSGESSSSLPPVAEGYRQDLLPNHPVIWF